MSFWATICCKFNKKLQKQHIEKHYLQQITFANLYSSQDGHIAVVNDCVIALN